MRHSWRFACREHATSLRSGAIAPPREAPMTQYLFRNVKLLDPAQDELLGGHEVLVEGELIREVSDRPLQAGNATVIDGGGRTLMPGLHDCHVLVRVSEPKVRTARPVP